MERTPHLFEPFYDPISGELMYDAVIFMRTGQSYNESTARMLLNSPGSENLENPDGLAYVPNPALRALVRAVFGDPGRGPPAGPCYDS